MTKKIKIPQGKMIVENCFIIPYGDYACKFDLLGKNNIFRHNYVYSPHSSFRNSPLMWLALKIINRKWKKDMKI